MTRSRIIVVLLFIVAFGAGLSVDKVLHRPTAGSERGASWLAHELNLTDPQRKEMFAIWDSLYKTGSDERTERRELSRNRNATIASLIAQDKQEEFERINEQYEQQIKKIMTQGRERYMKAVEETKAILTAAQREKYEELLAKREQQRRSRGGSGRGGPGRGGPDKHDGERSSHDGNTDTGPALKPSQSDPQASKPEAPNTPNAQSADSLTDEAKKVIPKTNE